MHVCRQRWTLQYANNRLQNFEEKDPCHSKNDRKETTKRMKWTSDMNIEFIRTFYYVNSCQNDPLPGWRSLLQAEYSRRDAGMYLSK